jgi:hypothetical protein
MNIVQKAILRVCWHEEQYGKHAPRSWLRWLLTRVLGIPRIPSRKSERSRMAKEQWLALRKEEALRIDPERVEVYFLHGEICDPYGVEDLSEEESYCIARNYFRPFARERRVGFVWRPAGRSR